MKINRLILRNYRNYNKLEINFNEGINIFIGNNAQGKTNILEAIYFGALGRSFRTRNDNDLIKWDYEHSSVDIFFTRQAVDNKLGFRFIKDKTKESSLNDFSLKRNELIGYLNAVLFSPEDLWLIKGVPVLRRRFIDIEISQAVPAYYRHLLQYSHILIQRNNLLKRIRERKATDDLLDVWDDQLAVTAVFLVNKRLEALKKIGMIANLMHRKLTANRENLSMSYFQYGAETNIKSELLEWYRQNLKKNRHMDILRGNTSIGPHRDDILLKVNNKELRTFGSQGQQRTGILSMKLAELEFLKSETGEYPVLLLDDVMSELDGQRREHLVAFIHNKIQTFITTTDVSLFPDIKAGQYYQINDGNVLER